MAVCGIKWEVMGKSDSTEMNSSFRLRGCFEHTLDDKGRVSVPSVFRQLLISNNVEELVVTNFICDGARCLEGFALPDWEAFEEKLAYKSRFDPKLKKLENFYLARAAYCSVDGSGRICIPNHLRVYAGMEKEVVFTSSLYGFRLWDQRAWSLVFQEAESALLENPELFMDVDR